MRALMIDNYDSFTYNLVQYFQMLGVTVEVFRNDEITIAEIETHKPNFVVLSPGPSDPDHAGISLALIQHAAAKHLPLLGVCLGHQCLGQAFGGEIVRAPQPVHGKAQDIEHKNTGVFAGLPSPLKITRYHSLMIAKDSLPKELLLTAETKDGVIMGVRHKSLKIEGVQFHPESVLTEHGLAMLENFVKSI